MSSNFQPSQRSQTQAVPVGAAHLLELRTAQGIELTAVVGGSVGGYIPPGGCVPGYYPSRLLVDLLTPSGPFRPQLPAQP